MADLDPEDPWRAQEAAGSGVHHGELQQPAAGRAVEAPEPRFEGNLSMEVYGVLWVLMVF